MSETRWSDLEIVLAVAELGTVSAAARALDYNHSTVLRRVRQYEQQSGLSIFERHRTGYKVTTAGELFVDAARDIRESLDTLDRLIAATDKGIAGELTITTTDSIFPVLTPMLREMKVAYPKILPRLLITNSRLDLDKRDADIAIRASNEPPPHLVGRKVCDLKFAVFANEKLAASEQHLSLNKKTWLGLEHPLSRSEVQKWMNQHVGDSKMAMASSSFPALAQMVEQGNGHAILPSHLIQYANAMSVVETGTRMPRVGLWVLSHRDVLNSPKVKAAAGFLHKALKAKSHLFEDAKKPLNSGGLQSHLWVEGGTP